MSDTIIGLGTRIQERRQLLQMSQAQLAAAVGVTAGAIGLIEQERRNPSTPVLMDIASYLAITVDDLLHGD